MFTWICPKCGCEVPPSYSECPNCAAQGAAEPQTAAPAAPPAQAPAAAAAVAPAPARHAVPGWLVALVVALVLVGVGFAAYLYLLPSSRDERAAAAGGTALEPVATPAAGAKVHPLAKHIEITGLRVTEDAKQKAQAKFVVVNHSAAELGDLQLAVTLRPTAAGQAPVASFNIKIPALAPYESREISTAVKTPLRAYEVPDWQFLRAEFEIISPPAP